MYLRGLRIRHFSGPRTGDAPAVSLRDGPGVLAPCAARARGSAKHRPSGAAGTRRPVAISESPPCDSNAAVTSGAGSDPDVASQVVTSGPDLRTHTHRSPWDARTGAEGRLRKGRRSITRPEEDVARAAPGIDSLRFSLRCAFHSVFSQPFVTLSLTHPRVTGVPLSSFP